MNPTTESAKAFFYLTKQITRLHEQPLPILTKSAYVKSLDKVHIKHPVVEVRYKNQRLISVAPWLYHYMNFMMAAVESDSSFLKLLNQLDERDASQSSGKQTPDTVKASSPDETKQS